MRSSSRNELPRTRRTEQAAATRRAIVNAARALFCEKGYFTTRVEEIAERAQVSPATIFATFDGKPDILACVIQLWLKAPIVGATLNEVANMRDARTLIALLANSCRRMREEFRDIVRLMRVTAPHDSGVAAMMVEATAEYREALYPFARKLIALDAPGRPTSPSKLVDVLWFYFGYAALDTLVEENGWSFARAEKWLTRECLRSIAMPDDA